MQKTEIAVHFSYNMNKIHKSTRFSKKTLPFSAEKSKNKNKQHFPTPLKNTKNKSVQSTAPMHRKNVLQRCKKANFLFIQLLKESVESGNFKAYKHTFLVKKHSSFLRNNHYFFPTNTTSNVMFLY